MYGSIEKLDSNVITTSLSSNNNNNNNNNNNDSKDNGIKCKSIIIAIASMIIVGSIGIIAFTGTSSMSLSSSGWYGTSIKSNIKSLSLSLPKTVSTSTNGNMIERIYYTDLSDSDKVTLFEEFLELNERDYASDPSSEEYSTRYENFIASLDRADDRNQAEELLGGEAIHGITKFSDYSNDEFLEYFLMTEYEGATIQEAQGGGLTPVRTKYRHLSEKEIEEVKNRNKKNRKVQEDVTATFVDWTDKYTTPVYDQGNNCRGASWAFSAIEQVESDSIRKGVMSSDETLSVQELLACVRNSTGCYSGSVEAAYDYMTKPGAIHYAEDFEYNVESTNEIGECTVESSGYALALGSSATVTKYHNELDGYTTDQVESNMLAHIAATGTLHACLDASTWSTYQSGTMYQCIGTTINHCVQVTGVNYDPVTNSGYYKVRNSWGSDFGESGYIRLAHGLNTCDITYNPGYTDPVDI